MYEANIKLSKIIPKKNFKKAESLEQEVFFDNKYILKGQQKYSTVDWDNRHKDDVVVEKPLLVTAEVLVAMDVI